MISKEELRKEALGFLKKNITGVITTVDMTGQPFISTVYYAVVPDFTIYFLTSRSTNKFKNITGNSKIAFLVGTGPEYVTLDIRGRAEMVEERDQAPGLELLLEVQKEYPLLEWPLRAVPQLKEGGLVMMKISPESARFLNLNSSDATGSIADYFYQIIP